MPSTDLHFALKIVALYLFYTPQGLLRIVSINNNTFLVVTVDLKGEFPEPVCEAGQKDLGRPGLVKTVPQNTEHLQFELWNTGPRWCLICIVWGGLARGQYVHT